MLWETAKPPSSVRIVADPGPGLLATGTGPNFFMAECAYCLTEIKSQPWVLMNRYAVGNGTYHSMTQGVDDDGDYLWTMGEGEDDEASGPVLCYPTCLIHWIEGRMMELNCGIET